MLMFFSHFYENTPMYCFKIFAPHYEEESPMFEKMSFSYNDAFDLIHGKCSNFIAMDNSRFVIETG